MSAVAMKWAESLPNSELGRCRPVLDFLAKKARNCGALYSQGETRWNYSAPRIAQEMGVSTDTIRRRMKELAQLGLLQIDKKERANMYRLMVGAVPSRQFDMFDDAANTAIEIAEKAKAVAKKATAGVKEVISEKKSEMMSAYAEWCKEPQQYVGKKKAALKVSQEQLATIDSSANAIATPASLAAIYEQEFAAWIEKGTAAPAEYTGNSHEWAFELFDYHHDESNSKPFRTNSGCRKFIRACREYSFRNSGQKSLWFFLRPEIMAIVIDQKVLPKAKKEQQSQTVQPTPTQKPTKSRSVSVDATPAFQKYAAPAPTQKPKKGMSPLSSFLTGLKGGE